MTHIYPNVDFQLFNVLVRWLQSHYTHKLEHYAATHKLAL